MRRTTIMMPPDLKERAERRARRLGSSFGALVRQSLEATLHEPVPAPHEDTLWTDQAVFRGKAPRDVAARHDVYLYEDES